MLSCREKLEALDPPPRGSEQFRLQQSLAIETSAVLLADCAFLQQSGMLAIGQDPSSACALTPIAALARATISMELVNHFRILDELYLAVSVLVKVGQFCAVRVFGSRSMTEPGHHIKSLLTCFYTLL